MVLVISLRISQEACKEGNQTQGCLAALFARVKSEIVP